MSAVTLTYSPRRGGSGVITFAHGTAAEKVEAAVLTRFRAREAATVRIGDEVAGGVEKLDRWTWWLDYTAIREALAAAKAAAAPALREGDPAFLLIDLSDDEPVGIYATLTEARRNAKKTPRYSIWAGRWDGESALDDQKRVAHCDPYDGDDDRVKQGLGMLNASEAAEDYQIDASQAGEDW